MRGRVNLVVNQDYWNPTGVGVKGCLGALCLCGSTFPLSLLLAYFLSLVLRVFFLKKSFVSSLKFFTCIHWSYPPPTPLQISPRLDISSSHLRVLNMLCFPGCHPLSDDGMLVVVAGVTLCGPCAAHHSCRAHEWKSRVVPRRQYFTAFSPSSPRAMSLSFGGVCPLRAGLNSHSLQYFGQFWNSVLMATHHGRGVPGWHWACFLFNNEDRRRQRHALCCIVRDAETSHHQRLLP